MATLTSDEKGKSFSELLLLLILVLLVLFFSFFFSVVDDNVVIIMDASNLAEFSICNGVTRSSSLSSELLSESVSTFIFTFSYVPSDLRDIYGLRGSNVKFFGRKKLVI